MVHFFYELSLSSTISSKITDYRIVFNALSYLHFLPKTFGRSISDFFYLRPLNRHLAKVNAYKTRMRRKQLRKKC